MKARRATTIAIALLALLATAPAAAEADDAAERRARWEQLSPEQRARLKQRWERFKRRRTSCRSDR